MTIRFLHTRTIKGKKLVYFVKKKNDKRTDTLLGGIEDFQKMLIDFQKKKELQ